MTSTAIAISPEKRKELLSALTAAGRTIAAGNRDAVVALKAAIALGETEADFTLYARQFHFGYLGKLWNQSAAQVKAWLDDPAIKKAAGTGETPTPFQTDYSASRKAWSRIREAAGLAKQKSKQTRVKPKGDVTEESEDVSATTSMAALIADVHAFETAEELDAALAQVAVYVDRIGKANVAHLDGDAGMARRDCIQAIAKAVRALTTPVATPAAKPVKVTKIAAAA